MERQSIRSPRIGEGYTAIDHPSGLKLLLAPMKGYSGAFASFATRYGSNDTCFKTQNDSAFLEVPPGIAHFLEHKMFEDENGADAFQRYAKTGASPNAYTTFDHTAYHFSCTDRFEDSLEILLDFVTRPYFTAETVEKEQGIIGQEIQMYQDHPDWRVVLNLLLAVYHHNPVRVDTVGTRESIAEITADLLYRCYHTFYNLHNMVLVAAGNFEIDAVLRVCDRILKPAPQMVIDRKVPEEPATVFQGYIEQNLMVAQPQFQIGFKMPPPADDGEALLGQIRDGVLLDLIAGESTPLYRRLYDQGLINAEFGTETMAGRGYAIHMMGGESREPQQVMDLILREVRRMQRDGIDPAAFSRAKKAVYGRYVGMFGRVGAVADMMLLTHFAGCDAFALLETAANLTSGEIEARLAQMNPQHAALSVVRAG